MRIKTGWHSSTTVYALNDTERHLGHIVRAGKIWIAFDAIHPDEDGAGFRLIGVYPNVDEAKRSVEDATILTPLMHAGV